MKQFLIGALLVTMAASAQAAGDPGKGQQKAASCAACHGDAGNSASAEFPKLAGQHEEYIVSQLKAYKAGERDNAIMAPMAMPLSEEDMADIGAYYEQQQTTVGATPDEYATLGEQVYRGGVTLTNAPACIACHGPAGKGNGPAGFPALSGQHADYTYNQLMAFKKGERETDANAMMRNAVKLMSEEQMRAVSEYIEGLYAK
ncbi:MAG: c-type cytochrome [Pseudomonadota bacterium]